MRLYSGYPHLTILPRLKVMNSLVFWYHKDGILSAINYRQLETQPPKGT